MWHTLAKHLVGAISGIGAAALGPGSDHHLLCQRQEALEQAIAMSTKHPAKTETSHEQIGFASALRDLLAGGVILVDAKEQVTFISDEVRHILGLAANVDCGASTSLLPVPIQHLIREGLSSGKPVAGREINLKAEEREPITVHASVAPLRERAPGVGVVVMVNDITSARLLQQNFRHFDRLASIGTLSASMAHEIRNALVAGKTCFDLLFEKHQDAELVDVARREIRRIDAIVSRVLKFVGPTEPAFGEVRLHEIVDHSLRLIQPQLEDKAISVNRSFEAAPDRVNGDALQLQQALVNLFLNALEAMGPSGTLTVATELRAPGTGLATGRDASAGARIGLTIRDTGAGIPAENLARLFEPFFTTKANGTGLGLPITKRIIQEHRGDITVQSEPNKGTTFQITFPVLDRPA
jgi:two-component system, NtrC family, sensor histidine kinase HydH